MSLQERNEDSQLVESLQSLQTRIEAHGSAWKRIGTRRQPQEPSRLSVRGEKLEAKAK